MNYLKVQSIIQLGMIKMNIILIHHHDLSKTL